MRVTKSALFLVIFILVFSIFVANLVNIVNVNASFEDGDKELVNSQRGFYQRVHPLKDSSEHIMWFLQVTDIHISVFHDQSRVSELREFCRYTIDIIKPKVVLASGDLTDAKVRDNIGSRQFEQEWKQYHNVLQESGAVEKTQWLDIRGNHDNFNIANISSKDNYFSTYSVQGKDHPGSYLYQVKQGADTYSFIALDASLNPGPKRPFNFIGFVSKDGLQNLIHLGEQSRAKGGNYIVWFGHYPTSCILSPGDSIRAVIGRYKESLVYMCGHLHQMGGLVTSMYTMHKQGFLELELGDWKENRLYRLAAIDHGFISFIDVRHGEWPVILVTNPKHALFALPRKENITLMSESTHIRLLVFSPVKLVSVQVHIDEDYWETCTNVKGPLYVAKWRPELFNIGVHYVHVQVVDANKKITKVTQPFSLDGTRLQFGFMGRFTLMSNASHVFQWMFGVMLLLCVFPLCLFRIMHKLVKGGKIGRPRIHVGIFRLWVRKLWVLSTVDRLFYPLVLYSSYLTVGPWSVGEIIEGYTGAIFAWGIYVKGAYLPGSFTYLYGFLQMFLCQFPLTLILANCVDKRVQYQLNTDQKNPGIFLLMLTYHVPFIMTVSMQMLLAYFFWLSYGTMAFLCGPMRTWSVILSIIMWRQAITLPQKCTREAASIWSNKPETLHVITNAEPPNAPM